ncbi:MAG: protein kinase, partial [Candidatus Latescibacteria bacterium]|nr:protein kinase [Candidatus Latescibacterota bacterium]
MAKKKNEKSNKSAGHADAQPQATRPTETKAGQEAGLTVAATKLERAEAIKAAEADISAEWNINDVILDLYEVQGLLGEGGFGKVYKVHHRGWNIDLAVKSPRQDYFQTEEQKENFAQECETWINLGLHPHTVSCYYVRTLGGIPRVFAEYVEGGSLKDWIDNRKLYERGHEKALERILDIAIQFAWGLEYAHEQKLIHQDVKPANVMMTADGTVKVTDFGLAKARAAAGAVTILAKPGQSMVVPGAGLCTREYASPEQLEGRPLTRRTDIWSWAVSILHMFKGELTWAVGMAAPMVLEEYLEAEEADRPAPEMPPVLAELLRQCFQDNPDARPKDMQEIVARLKEIYQGLTGEEYSRPEPEAAELLADGLNNKAISLLDLGKDDESEKLFDDALKSDPNHSEATYNRGLILWRSGRLTDDALIKQLEAIRISHETDWRDEYYLGLVHIERGDAESAIKILREAYSQAPDEEEIQRALTTARSGQGKWRSCLRTFEEHTGKVASVCISPDG